MRDVIERLVRVEIERQRPPYSYATVESIDRTRRRATVIFPGETVGVTVAMGAVQPKAVGQIVRVDGRLGDRFIADVMGETYVDDPFIDHTITAESRFMLFLGGAPTQSGWPYNLILNSAVALAAYDQSGGGNGAYKEGPFFFEEGVYHIFSFHLRGPNIGIQTVSVNGVDLPASVDGYNASYVGATGYFGMVVIPKRGNYTVRVRANGKNASSSSFFLCLSTLFTVPNNPPLVS